MENANSYEYLDKIKIAVIENLKKTAPVPSVQMQDVPRQGLGMTDEEEAELDDLDDDENKDVRMTQRLWEKSVARQDEFDESDDEEMAQAHGLNYNGPPRRSIMDYRNPNANYDVDSGAGTPARQPSPTRSGAKDAAEEVNGSEEVTMEDADAAPAADDEVAKREPASVKDKNVDDDGDVAMADSAAAAAGSGPIKKEEADTNQPATEAGETDGDKAAQSRTDKEKAAEDATISSDKKASPAPADAAGAAKSDESTKGKAEATSVDEDER